ncbi:MAG: replication initiation protein [Caldisericia bacterium]|nr:replication initiation protein [Caldisericia bacterium]
MEIVKYHNDLNDLVFKTFELKELDIFYTIIFKMKGKTEAIFTADEIKKMATTETGNRSAERFFLSLDKVFKTQLQVLDKEGVTDYHLFITKNINPEKTEVKIKLHPDCIYILNNLVKNFTKFELSEFLNLKSEYSKILFRHLKQFESTGKLIFLMQDFRLLFNVPNVYKQGHIDQKILNPIVKELQPIFKNLKYTKERKGVPVHKIIFTWDSIKKIDDTISESEKEKNKSNYQDIKGKFYTDETEELYSLLPQAEQIESRKAELDKLLKNHSFEYLKSDIAYCQKKKPKEFWGYFIKSTKEGHYSMAEIEKEKKKEEAKRKKEEKEREEKLIQEQEDKEKRELLRYILKEEIDNIQEKWDKRSDSVKRIHNLTNTTFDIFLEVEVLENKELMEKLRYRKKVLG